MHNYIYQIFSGPVCQQSWVSESVFNELTLLLPVAESISMADSRSQAIQHFGLWLQENHLGQMADGSFLLFPNAREQYFEGRFASFVRDLAALNVLTEKQFIVEQIMVGNLISQLQQDFCNSYGCYILKGADRPIPLDEFIRTAPANTPFYFGSVLDYHT